VYSTNVSGQHIDTTMVRLLQEAVTAIYDAHNTHPSQRISIDRSPTTAHLRATTVAMEHIAHEGNWPIGDCSHELAHLEWLLDIYTEPWTPVPPTQPPSRLRRVLNRLSRKAK
jgi:hypothetical protein